MTELRSVDDKKLASYPKELEKELTRQRGQHVRRQGGSKGLGSVIGT